MQATHDITHTRMHAVACEPHCQSRTKVVEYQRIKQRTRKHVCVSMRATEVCAAAQFRFGCTFNRLTALNCSQGLFVVSFFCLSQCRDLLDSICSDLLLIKQTLYGVELAHNLTDNCLLIEIFLFKFFCFCDAWKRPATAGSGQFEIFNFSNYSLPYFYLRCSLFAIRCSHYRIVPNMEGKAKRTYPEPAYIINFALLNSACCDMCIYTQFVCICCY